MFHCLGWLMPYASFMTGCKLVCMNNVKPGAALVPVFIEEKVYLYVLFVHYYYSFFLSSNGPPYPFFLLPRLPFSAVSLLF